MKFLVVIAGFLGLIGMAAAKVRWCLLTFASTSLLLQLHTCCRCIQHQHYLTATPRLRLQYPSNYITDSHPLPKPAPPYYNHHLALSVQLESTHSSIPTTTHHYRHSAVAVICLGSARANNLAQTGRIQVLDRYHPHRHRACCCCSRQGDGD